MRTITEFLLKHSAEAPVSFHMPGHKGSALYEEFGYGEFFRRVADCDITEIPGADNLFQTEGIILETMERYRRLYETRRTYLLVNGSSTGLISGIMSSVPRGGKLIMARNCHKSVFNGLALAGAEPVYAYPEMIPEYGVTGPVSPEEIRRCIQAAPEASAILLPSPNYYGICSDIAEISRLAHEAGMILIVDQAHGAHLKFLQPSLAAENLGADIVIDSTHKTLASFTQSAIANICSDRVDLDDFEDALQKMESTSPSYILMATLDINADLLEKHGAALMDRWNENLDWVYREAETVPGLHLMTHPLLDRSKVNLDMSACGLDGIALEAELNARGIWPELTTGNILMCMTGIGNRRDDYARLVDALREVGADGGRLGGLPEGGATDTRGAVRRKSEDSESSAHTWMPTALVQHPVPSSRIRMQLGDAAGRVCAQSLIPYPPGIPVICPGEELTTEIIEYVSELRSRGEKVMGVDSDGMILVGA